MPIGQALVGADYHAAPLVLGAGLSTGPVPPSVVTPAVPATTAPLANGSGVDVVVYLVTGGAAVSAIAVNGVATGLTLPVTAGASVTVYLPAGAAITLTYASTAPTWVWNAI